VLVAVLEHTPDSIDLVKMQEELVSAAGSQVHLLTALESTWTASSCFCSSVYNDKQPGI
jgi:predicted nucleotidyltransferase